jgi:hypothetical protein
MMSRAFVLPNFWIREQPREQPEMRAFPVLVKRCFALCEVLLLLHYQYNGRRNRLLKRRYWREKSVWPLPEQEYKER